MFDKARYQEGTITLEAGDVLVLFSDGVTETLNAEGREFGSEGLFGAINGGPINGPLALLDHCLGHITNFRGTAARNDDLTMLAIAYA